MPYQIRKAEEPDLLEVMDLYAYARQFMELHGNETQWGQTYPPKELLQRDISRGTLYVISDGTGIHGVFYFSIEQDPTYTVIHEGRWRFEMPYGVIHRIAGDGLGGILRTAVAFAFGKINHLRIDTHADNYIMQAALEKQGFSKRGIINVEDGSARIAYDGFRGVREAVCEDLQQILQVYLHLHETEIPEENHQRENTWNHILKDPHHHLIVYETSGRIVSTCVCVVIPNLTRGVRPYALIENVVTHRDYRGCGYATACLTYAQEVAQNAGCYKIMLLTGAKDEKTLAFYRHAGFYCGDKTAFIRWLKA